MAISVQPAAAAPVPVADINATVDKLVAEMSAEENGPLAGDVTEDGDDAQAVADKAVDDTIASEDAGDEEDGAAGEAAETKAEDGEGGEAADAADAAAKPETTTNARGEFELLDPEGPLEIPADVKLRFKRGGKVVEVDLAKTVAWAQNSAYNEGLEQEASALKERVPTLEQELQALRETTEQDSDTMARLFAGLADLDADKVDTDDAKFVLAALDRYKNYNTPEARAERAEKKLNSREREEQEAKIAREYEDFTSQTIAPKLQEILKDHPTVTWDELYGRFAQELRPLMDRNGRIPANRLSAVADLIDQKLAPWATSRHDARSSDKEREAAQSKQAVKKAQAEATLAKRALSRPMAPRGTAGTPSSSTPAKLQRITDKDIDSLVDRVIASSDE